MKEFSLLILMLFIISLTDLSAQWLDGYNYRKQISIQESQIPDGSDFNDFPVLINIEFDADLKDEFNGGYVNNSDGWDLVFTASNGTSLLDHDVEHYDETSGEFVAWVKVPTLDHDNNTIIYLYFGHDTPLTDPSKSSTWSNGFISVYHLHDDFLDASGNNDGTNTGSINATGRVANGQDFEHENSTDRIEIGNFDVFNDSMTISAWIRPESFDENEARIISKGTSSAEQDHYWMLATISDGTEFRFRLKTGGITSTHFSGPGILSTGSWQYVVAVYNGNTMDLFYNGSQVGTPLVKTGIIDTNSSVDVAIGNQPSSVSDWDTQKKNFDGIIDEVRISSAARSAQWLTAEYNNISEPGSFYNISAIENIIPLASAGPDQNLCGILITTLAGNAPEIGEGTWTQISGPGTISFGDIHLNNSSSTADTYGSYVLRWTVVNGGSSNLDEVEIHYAEASEAGPDQVLCGGLLATLEGNSPSTGTGTWTQISGPGSITFGDIHVNNSVATADINGSYILQWTIDNNDSCSTTDDVLISFDTIVPEMICPGNLTANCDISEHPAYENYSAFVFAGGSATDNCGIEVSSFTLYSEKSSGMICADTLIRTYQIADTNGNSGTCHQDILISDTWGPVFDAVPGNLTVSCDISEQLAYEDLEAFVAAGGSIIDYCGLDSTSFTLESEIIDDLNFPVTALRTYLMADLCGNLGTYAQEIIVADNSPPIVVSLVDTTIFAEAGTVEIEIILDPPVFYDSCGIYSVVNDYNEGTDASDKYPTGATTVIYTVTDFNGNADQFQQRIIVELENEPGQDLIIPEAFSPNEDGLNDRFEILGIEQYSEIELRIFNVHGIEVYRNEKYDNSWDGTSTAITGDHDKLPTGTYYYLIQLKPGDRLVRGFIYLRKE